MKAKNNFGIGVCAWSIIYAQTIVEWWTAGG